MLTLCFFWAVYRSVPTEDEILVPETLLKKRKSQEKAREERSAELEKKKKVGHSLPPMVFCRLKKLRTWTMVMIHNKTATRPSGRCCCFTLTIFRV